MERKRSNVTPCETFLLLFLMERFSRHRFYDRVLFVYKREREREREMFALVGADMSHPDLRRDLGQMRGKTAHDPKECECVQKH